jgi:hypothetical protein
MPPNNPGTTAGRLARLWKRADQRPQTACLTAPDSELMGTPVNVSWYLKTQTGTTGPTEATWTDRTDGADDHAGRGNSCCDGTGPRTHGYACKGRRQLVFGNANRATEATWTDRIDGTEDHAVHGNSHCDGTRPRTHGHACEGRLQRGCRNTDRDCRDNWGNLD